MGWLCLVSDLFNVIGQKMLVKFLGQLFNPNSQGKNNTQELYLTQRILGREHSRERLGSLSTHVIFFCPVFILPLL